MYSVLFSVGLVMMVVCIVEFVVVMVCGSRVGGMRVGISVCCEGICSVCV